MEITKENLITKVGVKIDQNLINKVIESYIKMAKTVNKNRALNDIAKLLKDELNIDESNKTSSSDFAKVGSIAAKIKDFYCAKGTYKKTENGSDPITNTQLGWYTFQSWKLQNKKKYKKDEISHRFYINASSKELPELMFYLIKEYNEKDMPYYFKVNTCAELGTKDALVIYSSTDQLDTNLSILSKIENEHPDLTNRIKKPHLLTGNINNWVGYASENKSEKGNKSYTRIMSDIFIDAFKKSTTDWVKEHPTETIITNGGTVLLKNFFNDSLLDDTNNDYMNSQKDHYNYIQRRGYLLYALPNIDKTFPNRLLTNIQNETLKRHIFPENICFNHETKKELNNQNDNSDLDSMFKDTTITDNNISNKK